MKIEQLQKIIFEYFKDTDDITLIEIINSFVYDIPNPSLGAGKIIEKFIEDNGLEKAFINYHYDKDNSQYFRRSNMSETSMIENIKMSFLGLSYNRFSKNTEFDSKIKAVEEKIAKREIKIQKIKDTANTKSLIFLKNTILSCYSTLNNNDNYFYNKKEDAKFVSDIKKFEFI